MLAAATRLQDTAVALFPVFLFFFLAFGGFIVRLPTLPGYLGSWAPPISFVRWAMEVRVYVRVRGLSRGGRGRLYVVVGRGRLVLRGPCSNAALLLGKLPFFNNGTRWAKTYVKNCET